MAARRGERARCRRPTEEAWANIERYLAEYRRIAGAALPEDIAQIAAHFGTEGRPRPPQQASAGKYNVQIGEAQGTVIGDNAQVTMNLGGRPREDG